MTIELKECECGCGRSRPMTSRGRFYEPKCKAKWNRENKKKEGGK